MRGHARQDRKEMSKSKRGSAAARIITRMGMAAKRPTVKRPKLVARKARRGGAR